MSAFIVSEHTMRRAVNAIAIAYELENGTFMEAASLDTLGRDLFALNVAAVAARYPNDKPSELPGSEPPAAYVHPGAPVGDAKRGPSPYTVARLCDVYKGLTCLLSQCSEGDQFESSPVFVRADKARDAIMRAIIPALPEYDAAPWDEEGPEEGCTMPSAFVVAPILSREIVAVHMGETAAQAIARDLLATTHDGRMCHACSGPMEEGADAFCNTCSAMDAFGP